MQIVDQYYQHPHQCMFTHSASVEKPILDTGLHIEFEGRVYMSGAMLEEACRLIGWSPPEELELVTTDRDGLQAQVEDLTAQIERFGHLESAITDAAETIRGARESIVAAVQAPQRGISSPPFEHPFTTNEA